MMKEYMICHMTALSAAIILDIVLPDPQVFIHPIRLIGSLIARLERMLYRKEGRVAVISGCILWTVVVLMVAATSFLLMRAGYKINKRFGIIIETVMTYFILAAGSLRNESMKVYSDLEADDTEKARHDLSMIVGRDTQKLDTDGITRAAVETVAENTSDGVVAPLIYTALLGPVGGFVYKAINTMDSMLAYRNERYEYFGKAAAVMDDAANYIPSRLCALFMIASAGVYGFFSKEYSACNAYRIWRRDRRRHKSPNSAQTESACAGALGIRLGGDSYYGGVLVKKPFIGDETRPVRPDDIKLAVYLMFGAEAVCTAVIYIITELISTFR